MCLQDEKFANFTRNGWPRARTVAQYAALEPGKTVPAGFYVPWAHVASAFAEHVLLHATLLYIATFAVDNVGVKLVVRFGNREEDER